jgi:hypothetical protein
MIHIKSVIQAGLVLKPYNSRAKKFKLHSKKKREREPMDKKFHF